MDPRRWQQVKTILDQASRAEPETWPALLAEACGDDDDLQAEVRSLLAYCDRAGGAVERPVFDVNAEDPRIGRRIGHYRIVRQLGRGGMGVVYLATREDDYSQRVALKLIQRGFDSRDRVARFHEERQILADLEHPAIARLLDGGTTEDGLPYLVMELVEGEPIDEYCDRRRLDLRRRLGLFRRILSAVATSHRHLVVHRDLKPSNVLVTADGTLKLIDFGIAKLLQPAPAASEPPAARQRRRPLSPGYASPEQVRGEAITTASDVYSLGVLLYELLSGSKPYRVDSAEERDWARVICDTVPESPSSAAAIAADGAVSGTLAELRGTTPKRLRRRLAGDLDAIAMKALHKRPEERYGSAEEMADDIDRHLAGLPLPVLSGSMTYRVGKFLRRHRLALAATLLLLAAVAATVASLALHSRALHQRARTEAIEAFVENLFRASDPDRADGRELTVRELLDRGGDELTGGLEEQPLVQAALTAVVGRVYHNLGELDRAERLLSRALELQRRHDPGDAAAVARRANDLAAVLHERGRRQPAEALYREALERLGGCRSTDPDAPWIAGNLALSRMDSGDLAEAESLLECLRDRRRRGLEIGDDLLATGLNKLGALRFHQQRLEEAEELFRQALALRRAYFGPRHTKVANTLNNLGKVLYVRGRPAEAEGYLKEALEIREALLDEGHPDLVNTRRNLAEVLAALAGDPGGGDRP